MQPSDNNSQECEGQSLAVIAEALYLSNLLLVPGLSFAVLLWLHLKHRKHESELAQSHLYETVKASLWVGVLLVVVNILIFLMGGYESANTWLVVIIYFTTVHSAFVLLGMLGLAKAMACKVWRYPLP
ncbi:MAG: hypothetical protein OQK73_06445 [Gammaproteobacteria bacterium]|nr:hypothetical protein [Gammaproteobacteria bacterium]